MRGAILSRHPAPAYPASFSNDLLEHLLEIEHIGEERRSKLNRTPHHRKNCTSATDIDSNCSPVTRVPSAVSAQFETISGAYTPRSSPVIPISWYVLPRVAYTHTTFVSSVPFSSQAYSLQEIESADARPGLHSRRRTYLHRPAMSMCAHPNLRLLHALDECRKGQCSSSALPACVQHH